ncbi:Elongator complex 5 [Paramuricea clavata]|uniref:Elongator complex protein 5 n=1 Tax=Paramuricea clavata TaxID=317549 RepID=A0A6S7GDF6_PARCT|nr:Elongator complex 5 [Paramuricea clavata]
MLENLVSGKENSRFILVHDTVQHRGNCILNYITQGLLNRLDIVILFLLDKHSRNFINSSRLYVHDGFTDPLKWVTAKSSSSEPISKPFFLKNVLTKTIENDESFTRLLSEKSMKVGIIINSLSSVISHQNIAVVCRDLCELLDYHTQSFEVKQIVALVHSDLHDENILSSINYIASTSIELKNFVDKKERSCHFIITHCKKSGKLTKKKEAYRIDSGSQVKVIPIEDKNNTEVKTTTSSESEDITSNLTFNLTLTEAQKQARAQLQLPYLLDDKTRQTQLDLGKKSQIFYEADEADDMDEEDPDDDLNI